MKEFRNNWRDIMKDKRYLVRVTTKSRTRRSKKTKRLLWSDDLAEVLGQSKHKNPVVSPIDFNSEFSDKKIKGILKMKLNIKQIKIRWLVFIYFTRLL